MKTTTVKNIEQAVKQQDKVLTIKEDDTVERAAVKMSEKQVGCLVVLDAKDKFAGLITERDMLEKVVTTSLSPDKLLVGDIMTTDVISCTMDTPVAKIEQVMAERKIRHIPIVEDGVPIGMVSSRDVIAHQLSSNLAMKNAAEQLAMLPTALKTLDYEEVVALAVNEVPKSFNADNAVLCLTQEDSSAPAIYRKGGPLIKQTLLEPEKIQQLLQYERIVFGKTSNKICNLLCRRCNTMGDQPIGIVIPLRICDQLNTTTDGNITTSGFLCMCWLNPDSAGPEDLLLYKASLLRDVLSVNFANAKLYQNYKEARRKSETDPLTGLGTRRVLEEALKVECARAERYNRRFSVAILDIDNFKQINDTAGHAAGDSALKLLADIMRQNLRMTDVVMARYGGDEFVLLMLETKLTGAKVILERLRRHINTISLPKVKSFTITRAKSFTIPKIKSVTISCGLAEWSEGPPSDTAETILKRADDALYEAKNSGRNRVVTASYTEAQVQK
jgi:diguanylate cyclase (GGDEF)-like protein